MVKKRNTALFYGDFFEERNVSDRVYFYSNFSRLTKPSFMKLHSDLRAAQQKKGPATFWYAEELNYIINGVFPKDIDFEMSEFLTDVAQIPEHHSKQDLIQVDNLAPGSMADLFAGPVMARTRLSHWGSYLLTGTWWGTGPYKDYLYKDVFEDKFQPNDMLKILQKEADVLFALFFFMCPDKSWWDIAGYVYGHMQIKLYDKPFFTSAIGRLGAIVNQFQDHSKSDFNTVYEKIFESMFGRDFKREFYDIYSHNIENDKRTYTYYRYLRPEYLFLATQLMNRVSDKAEQGFDNYFYKLRRHQLDFGSNSRKNSDATHIYSEKQFEQKPEIPTISEFYDWIAVEGNILRNTLADEKERYKELSTSPTEDQAQKYLYRPGPVAKHFHAKLKKDFYREYSNQTALTFSETLAVDKEKQRIRAMYPVGFPREFMTIMGLDKIKEKTA